MFEFQARVMREFLVQIPDEKIGWDRGPRRIAGGPVGLLGILKKFPGCLFNGFRFIQNDDGLFALIE